MKRKILACVLACATLFLGMGYAYWTDSLQIDTTATTGELEVNFIDLAVYGQYAGQDHETGWAIVDGVGDGVTPDWFFDRDTKYNIIADQADLDAYNARIWGFTQTEFNAELKDWELLDVKVGPYTKTTHASDTITIQLNKMYPGFAQVFQADIVNTGTIAAKLADLKLTIGDTSNTAILDMIGVNFKVLREYAMDTNNHVDVFDTTKLGTDDFFNLAGVDFVRLSALDDLLANDSGLIENDLLYVLPDDNRMDIYVGIAMDPDLEGAYTTGWTGDLQDNDDAVTELENTKFQIQFLWDQFNIGNPEGGDHGQLEDGQSDPVQP